jgi:hypothetical protein
MTDAVENVPCDDVIQRASPPKRTVLRPLGRDCPKDLAACMLHRSKMFDGMIMADVFESATTAERLPKLAAVSV